MEDITRFGIRRARLFDVPAISRLEMETSGTPWSSESITRDITSNDKAYMVVAELGESDPENGILGDVIGYADMWIVAGEAELNNIAIDEKYRGHHFGEQLLDHLLTKCREAGCKVMNLDVRKSNQAAIALYEKMGFERVGIRPRYYRNNKEDAILMTKYIGDVEVEYTVDIE
ncbi:MAG: ribosomal protein S18-alanine N-acetyltransferase [Mogibacterium sp.]|nr:ribosomal protein S18-alanine N-acetyltransferase [Mogibacterium sp.]MBR2540757.1 ribosomal protein S18-alanine N-acetyltransferase [Mogibacterium sp.]